MNSQENTNNNLIKSCARHKIVYINMKIKSLFLIAVIGASVIVLSSFKSLNGSNNPVTNSTTTHLNVEGARCNYTVGCGCPGFAPIQHQEVYKLSYCKNCGHHKKYHK